MCKDVCMDMSMHMDLCIGMCIACTEQCVHMYYGHVLCIIDICADMCIEMSIGMHMWALKFGPSAGTPPPQRDRQPSSGGGLG